MFYRSSLVGGLNFQHKFGGVENVSSADLPIDVWDIKTPYPFPSSAEPTTLVSDSPEDGPGQNGALTVSVFGLDQALKLCTSIETMEGESPVPLPVNYYRVFRINAETAGDYNTNIGNIDVKHGSVVLARIQPDYGSTLMTPYTITGDVLFCYLKKLYLDVNLSVLIPAEPHESIVTAHFQYRKPGGAWQVKQPVKLSTKAQHWNYVFPDPGLQLVAGSDLRWRILDISGDDIDVFAGFDLREVM